jgi:hypothetical protein
MNRLMLMEEQQLTAKSKGQHSSERRPLFHDKLCG